MIAHVKHVTIFLMVVMAAVFGSIESLDAAVYHLVSNKPLHRSIVRFEIPKRAGRSHGTTKLRFGRCKNATVERPLDVSYLPKSLRSKCATQKQ